MKTVNASVSKSRSNVLFDAKLLLLAVAMMIVLSGCTSYQYVYIDSNLPKSEIKEFIHETDSFQIKYAFYGENFGVKITIHNKLEQPVFIDWGRTTLFINGIQEDGSFYTDDQVRYIEPDSYVTFSSSTLIGRFIDTTPQDTIGYAAKRDKSKIHLYNENNTPISFRNILSLTTHEDLSYPIFFDDSFWISEIYQTLNAPEIDNMPSNAFYIRRPTGFYTFTKTFTLTGLLIFSIFAPQQ
jgi:hypothetical protein